VPSLTRSWPAAPAATGPQCGGAARSAEATNGSKG
jgi:hypothetical protein